MEGVVRRIRQARSSESLTSEDHFASADSNAEVSPPKSRKRWIPRNFFLSAGSVVRSINTIGEPGKKCLWPVSSERQRASRLAFSTGCAVSCGVSYACTNFRSDGFQRTFFVNSLTEVTHLIIGHVRWRQTPVRPSSEFRGTPGAPFWNL